MDAIKEKFKYRDRCLRLMSKDGRFRASVIKNTNAANLAVEKHKLSGMAIQYLAKTLSAASLLSMFLKGEERVIVDITSDNGIQRLFAEAMQVGEVRGFAELSPDTGPGRYLEPGNGFLKVSRILYNRPEPLAGVVPLVVGDIASDLAYYLHQSEQIPSTVMLIAETDKEDATITRSGGIIVQAMPGTTFREILEIEQKLMDSEDFFDNVEQGLNSEDALRRVVPFDFEVVKTTPVDFFCRCSKDSFVGKLLTLESSEIEDMKLSRQNELVCRYCNAHYYLEDADYDTILTTINSRKN